MAQDRNLAELKEGDEVMIVGKVMQSNGNSDYVTVSVLLKDGSKGGTTLTFHGSMVEKIATEKTDV